jgi:hypothetical protein
MPCKLKFFFLIFLVGCVTIASARVESLFSLNKLRQDSTLIPHLEKRGKAIQLMVDNKPYLVLGGELHNSSSSSLEYMKPMWPKLAKAHLNTVLAPVSWELTEPQKGKFDFHLVDGMIQQARKNNLHLILLWFGSWKNGQSHYAPIWVKKNEQQFPLVKIKNGKHLEILSPLNEQTAQADAAAFAQLMKHIKHVDGEKHTVIMMQVENEVGILADSRDRSNIADKTFAEDVPVQLVRYLQDNKNNLRKNIYQLWKNNGFKASGNWTTIFGEGTAADELFMAWKYAHFINEVAKAGKKEYPLPMYVNAWIVQPQDKGPGDYPGGGPQAHVHDIWKAAAPDIDMLSPDIYLPNFAEICNEYKENDKGFFTPESRSGEDGAGNAFYAIGACNSIDYSPFGVDGNINEFEKGPISKAYEVLSQLAPLILKAQCEGTIAAVSLDKNNPRQKIHLGNYILDVERRHSWDTIGVADKGYALIIATGPDEYFVAGNDFQITFFPDSGSKTAGFDYVEEGFFEQGKWLAGRRLNGDEISTSIRLADMAAKGKTGTVARVAKGPAILKVKLYRF